jgi:AcrR family transcriptional regulator
MTTGSRNPIGAGAPPESRSARPLRADAERNRQRILDAARELFAQRGLGVTLNDIAHHAGVGVGTVYRRFPDKMQLIDDLFEQRLEQMAAMLKQAVDDPDPWRGLSRFMARALELQASDRGFKEIVLGSGDTLARGAQLRARMLPLAAQLVERARRAGQLRPDFTPQDIPITQLMIGTVIDAARDVKPDLWRRYLEIFLQGIRAEPSKPEPLATSPVGPDEVPDVLAAWQPPRR